MLIVLNQMEESISILRVKHLHLVSDLATFDGAESRVNTLVAAANSHDNLCRMDPAWHPWL